MRHTRPPLRLSASLGMTFLAASTLLGAAACTVENGGPDDDPTLDAPGLDDLDLDDDDDDDPEPEAAPEPDSDPGPEPGPAPEPEVTPEPDPGADLCTEGPDKGLPSSSNVYYGTDTPDYLTTMTTGQMLAIGTFWGCSGTIINEQWVLTAEHCGVNAQSEFCVGSQPGNPNICFDIVQAFDHPGGADLTLARLDVPFSQRAPDLVPLPILFEDMDNSWLGRTAEAAGYGQQETGQSGRREFSDEVIVEVGNDKLSIDGQGVSGVCFGDSGGPVMVYDEAGDIRVAGALSWGDPSCVDVDRYTRVDLYRDWILDVAGPPLPTGPVPCGTVSTFGSCNSGNSVATFCGSDGFLVVDNCSGGDVCGYNGAADGWRCMNAAADPCAGAGSFGSCDGGVLSWCTSAGVPQQRDCGACGESCQLIDDDFGFGCKVSACGDIDYSGVCQGDTAVWCNTDDELSSQDCGAQGKTCGWHSEEYGNWCVDAPVEEPTSECGDVDYFGACNGDVAVWCSNSGELRSEDCGENGQSCGYVNDNIGYYCTE